MKPYVVKPKTQSEARSSKGLEGRLEGRLVMEGHLKICWGRAYLISTLSPLQGPLRSTAGRPSGQYKIG